MSTLTNISDSFNFIARAIGNVPNLCAQGLGWMKLE